MLRTPFPFQTDERLRQFVDAVPSGVLVVNSNGLIDLANAEAMRLFGYSREMLVGQPVEILIPKHAREKHPHYRHEFFNNLETRQMGSGRDLLGVRADGTEFPLEIGLNPVEIDGEKLVLATIVDITRRKKVELALRESEARFRQVFDVSPSGILVVNSSGIIDLANTEATRLFGYSQEMLVGQPVEILIPKHSREKHPHYRNEFYKHLETRQMGSGRDLSGVRADGTEFPLEIGLSPIEIDGETLVLATIVDITKRKLIEQELASEKERLQVTLHSIGDGVITTDAEGKIKFMNPIAETLTGWLTGEANGQSLEHIFKIVTEVTHKPVPNPVTLCLQQQRVVGLPDNVVLINRQGIHYAIQDSAAPIRTSEGNILGAVLVFQDVTEARGLIQQIHHQACHDNLTGLLNRYEFEQRLMHALKSTKDENLHHALCFLDLDNFKIVNDTAGHLAGDALLKQIAHLLGSQLRTRDSLARLGGDEFGLLLECCPLDQAITISEKLLNTIRSLRFTWNDHIYEIGVSIGIVPITANSDTVEQLLSQADVACYAAKDQGRNQVVVYHTENGAPAHRHSEMLQAAGFREALEKDRFCLYAQPIKALADDANEVTYYELLVRVRDNDGEILMPGTFIPAAERYQLMGAIDRWVIKTAVDQYGTVFGTNSIVRIAMNLSGNSLTDSTFLNFVTEQLNESGVPPDRVCFEITETAVISNLKQATRLIAELKNSGCSVALDDFGSGLSSFNYLKQFPIDYLKIDGSFMRGVVDDPIDQAMVESINHIGHVMGIKTIAEWVENNAILDQLKSIRVDYAQGYAIGHPIPLTDITK